jgi:hypothetical protein
MKRKKFLKPCFEKVGKFALFASANKMATGGSPFTPSRIPPVNQPKG